MYTKIWVMSVILVGLLGSVWFSSSHASEGKAPSPEAAKNIGPVLVKAYTFEPVRPNLPDHLWLDEGNGRVQFMMFDKVKASKVGFVPNLSLIVGRQALTIFIGSTLPLLEIRQCTARKARKAIG